MPMAEQSVDNYQTYQMIARCVAEKIFGEGAENFLKIGPLSANYYSFTFPLIIKTKSGEREVFVKIPKDNMIGKTPRLLPITTQDREMAIQEETSLRLLDQNWDAPLHGVSWVKLCGTLPKYNALVTDRVYGEDAFVLLRNSDLSRRLCLAKSSPRINDFMSRMGASLNRFHHICEEPATFQLSGMMPKFVFYCQALAGSTGSSLPERILSELKKIESFEVISRKVQTLKGLDIRNILINSQNRIQLLDPGKIKFDFREADLARFITTYRLLYWGSKRMMLLNRPNSLAELEFLRSYFNKDILSNELLALYLIKEGLKHWHNVMEYVRCQDWPRAMKKIVIKLYINPFFCRLLKSELSLLGIYL